MDLDLDLNLGSTSEPLEDSVCPSVSITRGVGHTSQFVLAICFMGKANSCLPGVPDYAMTRKLRLVT